MKPTDPPAPGEEPILAKLSKAGYGVSSLAELRHSKVVYRKAIPILIAALSKTSDVKTQMELVRALSVPWAKPDATGPLIEFFQQVTDPAELGLRWAVGNALDITWDDLRFDDLVDLARNPAYGRAREMLVLGFGRSKRAEAADVLIDLLDDHSVSGHAVKALGKLKVPAARAGLQRMLEDDRAWVRREAKRALASLD